MPTSADLRDFLTTAFSDEEITTLCFDHFRAVYDNFSGGISKGQKIQNLLEFCERHGNWQTLFDVLQRERSQQFTAFLDTTTTAEPPGKHAIDERPTSLPYHAHVENPFYTAGRINDPKLFFGREQLVRELRQELSKRTNVSLVGESQMGKSSLLYYLYATREEWLPGEAIEYLDLQRVFDEADFCEMVLQQLNATGKTLRDLRYALGTRRVILLLDEVERLAEPDFSPRLHDLLRSLAQEPNFKMCVATQCPLEEVFPARTRGGVSPFHNIFTRKVISSFTESEARRFLTARLLDTGVIFTEDEVVGLIAESHCHPAKLQRLAKDLFDEKVSDA